MKNFFFFSLIFSIILLLITSFQITAQSEDGGFKLKEEVVVGSVNDIAYFPDGTHIALAANPIPEIINKETMKISYTLIGQKGNINTIDVSDQYIITGSDDGTIFLWNREGEFISSIQIEYRILKTRFHPRGESVAILTSGSELLLYSIPAFKIEWTFILQGIDEDFYPSMEWNLDGSRIALVNGQPGIFISIINASEGVEEIKLYDDLDSFHIFSLTWETGSSYLAVSGEGTNNYHSRNIDIWDLSTTSIVNRLFGYVSNTYSIHWMRNTEFILSGDISNGFGNIRIWRSNFSLYQNFSFQNENFLFVVGSPVETEFIAFSKTSEKVFLWTWDQKIKIERPCVIITQPEDFQDINTKEIEVTGNAWGPKEITEVRIRLDNDDWQRAMGTSSWHISLSVGHLSPGLHKIIALSFDGSSFSNPCEIYINVTFQSSEYRTFLYFTHPEEFSTVNKNVYVRGEYLSEKGNVPPKEIWFWVDEGTKITIDPGYGWEHYWNSTKFFDGEHILHARAFDGNIWSNTASIVVVTKNDNSPPSPTDYLEIDKPEEGEIVNGTIEIVGRAFFPRGTISVYIYLMTDGEWIKVTGNTSWNYSIDTTLYPDGAFQFIVKADNEINDTLIKNRTILIYNNNSLIDFPPTITITSPTTGSTLQYLSRIEGTATDDFGLELILVRIDSGEWVIAKGTSEWYYALPNLTLTNGNHVISAKSFDGKQYSEEAAIKIQILENGNNTNGGHFIPNPDNGRTTIDDYLTCLTILILSIAAYSLIYLFITKRRQKKQQKR